MGQGDGFGPQSSIKSRMHPGFRVPEVTNPKPPLRLAPQPTLRTIGLELPAT